VTYVPRDAGLIDVTKPPYNAKGDGATDDTAAIRKAVMENLEQHKTLFFPAGTYLVSDTIEWKNRKGIYYAHLTWQGQGAAKSILRLKDQCAGFSDPREPRPICRTGSSGTRDGRGNRAHNNYIFNMTVDVGQGNPGAIGIDFNASNGGALFGVDIISRDGKGSCGLKLTRDVGPCLIKHVRIKGFETGVETAYGYGITFEYLRLENQSRIGFRNRNSLVAIRKLASINSVPALRTETWVAMVVLLDSELRGGAPDGTAVVRRNGKLIFRNVGVEGYRFKVNKASVVDGPRIVEYAPPAAYLFHCRLRSLNLPVLETPEFHEADPKRWANVERFGARPGDRKDDADGVQKAIDSGATTVYFPWGYYQFDKPVIVRRGVRRIIGYKSILQGSSRFRCENAEHPVIIERFNFWGDKARPPGVENASAGGVAVRFCTAGRMVSHPEAKVWFFEDGCTAPLAIGKGQKLYARHLNCEMWGPPPLVTNDGGLFWVLGYKTEFGNTVLSTTNGGRSEILGGFFYPAQGFKEPPAPCLVNVESSVSASYFECVHSAGNSYRIKVKETRSGVTRQIEEKPRSHYICPLYVGRPRDATKE